MTVDDMADEVAALLEDRLRIGGAGLAAKLKRGGRMLPRPIRRQALYLVEAQRMAGSPKLYHQLDQARIAEAHDACVAHLAPIGQAERRRGVFLDTLAGVALAVIAVFGLLVWVLVWRGYL